MKLGKIVLFIALLLLANAASYESIVSIEKNSFELNEKVTINLNYENLSSTTLRIYSPNKEYSFFNPKSKVMFIPKVEGNHQVKLYHYADELGSVEFNVGALPKVEEQTIIDVPESKESNETEDYQPIFRELTDSSLKVTSQLSSRLFIEEKQNAQLRITEARQRYILKFENSAIKEIDFPDALIHDGSELRIDEIREQEINDLNSVSQYAIDPRIDFSNATVTVTAKGTELWKCPDWDYEQQTCLGSWKKVKDITPGMNYTFFLNSQDSGFAELGVAAVNSDKPVYHPNETVILKSVVLNRFGYLTAASVSLFVKTPDGNINEISAMESSKGIYESTYTGASIQGDYEITVIAKGQDVDTNLTSRFSVADYYGFDITRDMPIVIDPWRESIHAKIKISPNVEGTYSFTEKIPSNFFVTDYGEAEKTLQENEIHLTWTDLEGETIISYKAAAPKISPELYSFISYIDYGSVFNEARPYYVAIDPRGVTGYFVYKDTTNANVIKYRLWNTTTNSVGSERSGPNVGSPPAWTRFVCMKEFPDCIWMGIQFDATLDITVYHEDTDTWDPVTNLGTVDDDYMPFDVACEDLSGECLIVYETSTAGNNQFAYRNYSIDGTLSGEGTISITAATNNAFRWIKLYPQYGTDRIGAVFQNLQAGGGEIEAAIWNGSAFTNWQELYNDQSDLTRKTFDCAWEGSSGEFMCFYARDVANGIYAWNFSTQSNTWSDEGEVWAAADIGNEPANMVACGENTETGNLNHNYIMLMVQDAGSDLAGTAWNGTAFRTDIDPTADTGVEWVRDETMACSWEHDGDTAVMMWVDGGSLTPEWGTFTLSSMSFSFSDYALGSTTGSTTWADDVESLEISLAPETDEMLITGISLTNGVTASEVECTRWTGSTFDATSCGNIETTGALDASGSREFFGYAATEWSRYNPPPNVTILNLPANNTNQTFLPLNFTFNVTDNYGIRNCSLFINSSNWTAVSTKTSIVNKKQNNISLSTLADGRYKWNILCYDNSNPAKSDWYTYNYTFRLDTKAPVVSNISTSPDFKLINTNVRIFAGISDMTKVAGAFARITLPNSTVYNFTMQDADGNSIFNTTFTEAGIIGTYNLTIYANDSFSFLNYTIKSNFTVSLENLTLSTNRNNYVVNQNVKISGKGFNPLKQVSVIIYDPTGDPVTGYPKNITSNITGGLNETWSIPLTAFLGDYVINATDTSDSSRSERDTFEVVTAIIRANKTSFEQGQIVLISGEFWDVGYNVTVNITGPAGNEVFGPINVTANTTGTFNTTWLIPFDADIGYYLIRGYEPDDSTKTDTYNFSITARTINLETEYPWYKQGETVKIYGDRFSPFSNITLDIIDSTGASIAGYPKNISSNSTGGINDTVIMAYGLSNFTINATDTSFTNLNKNITFEVTEPIIYTDEILYNDDDPVIITGEFWDRGSIITLNLTNSSGRNDSGFPKNIISNSTGGFSYTATARAVGVDAVYYNVTAYDNSNPNENATARYGVFKRAELVTDKSIYVQGEYVQINGSSYTPSGTVTLRVKYSNGGTALTYPRTLASNINGIFNHTFDLLDYCPGTYTVIGTDISNPLLNASDTFTVRDWWNTSWEKRKPIKVTNRGSAQSSVPVLLNITGLAGNISNCYELRIISTLSNEDVPYNVYFGDDSNLCEVEFLANVSSGAVNETNYYVYYNNTAAANMNYEDIGREVELFYDNFFDANLDGWTQDLQNDWAWDSERSYDPGGGAMLIDGVATNAYINLTNYFNISPQLYRSVNFSSRTFIEAAWDAGESVRIQFFDGNAWVQVDSIDGAGGTGAEENNWMTTAISLTGTYYVSNFNFRFISTVNSGTEDGHVDVVNLTARYKGTEGISSVAGIPEEYSDCELIDVTNPYINILQPLNYTNTTDSTPRINFTATDNTDLLLNYSIFIDGISNGQKGNATNGTIKYLNISTLSQGNHNITVVVKDDYSNNYNDTLILTVDYSGPLLNLTQPRNFTNISASSYNLIASAFDQYTRVDAVTFLYRKNTSVSWTQICKDTSSPYSCSWDTGSLAEGNSYQVRSYANDSLGNIGLNYTSTNITIDRTGPLVNITLPINHTNISTTSYQVSASAYDRYSDVRRVSFYYRTSGSWVFACSDSTLPYQCTWNLAAITDRKNIQLRAYGNDSLGNAGFNYTVFNLTKDTTAPTLVNITIFPFVQTLGKTVRLTVNTSDLLGTREVKARISKPGYGIQTYRFTQNITFHNLTYWNTSVVGRYNITLILNDTLGNSATHSKNFTINYETLQLDTIRNQYIAGETVYYYGKGFGARKNITVNIYNSTGVSVSGYPRNVTSNSTGGFNYSWTVPLSQVIGTYTINATDISDISRSIEADFEIVTAIVEPLEDNYEQSEKVYFTGSFWDSNEDITVNITDPSGYMVYGPANVTSNNTGYINFTWQSDYNSTIGGYLVSAYQPSSPNKKGNNYFNITRRPVSISVQYSWYRRNDTVVLHGKGFSPLSTISLRLFNSSGNIVTGFPINLSSNSTGGINYSYFADIRNGNYTFNATDLSYENLNNLTSIEILSPILYTDQLIYVNGDTVYITGLYFDRLANVTIDIINETGGSLLGYPKNLSSDSDGQILDYITAEATGIGFTNYNITAFNPEDRDENASASYSVQRVALLSVPREIYDQSEIVNITGNYFSQLGIVRFLIAKGNLFAPYYPKYELTDIEGDVNHLYPTNALCEGNYMVYATDETYSSLYANTTFNITNLNENTTTKTVQESSPSGSYTLYSPSYTFTYTSNNIRQFIGAADLAANFAAHINYTFNLTSVNTSEELYRNLSFTVEYCHSGAQVNPVCGQGVPHEGDRIGKQDIEFYNFSDSTWVNISGLSVNDASDAENTHRFSYNESIGDFIHNNQLMIRFELNFTQSGIEDDVLLIDYLSLRVDYFSALDRPCSNFTGKFLDIKNWDSLNELIEDTSSYVYNTTSKIDNGTGNFFRYLPFRSLNVLVTTPFNADNLSYKIFGLNYTSSVNITSQVNENYSYSLPALVTNVTPFIAVNDTSLNFSKTQLRIPKRGLDINTILHCTSYNYSNAQCLLFELNDTDDYEFNETANYIIFNVTTFDSFGGGSASTLPNITDIHIWNVTGISDTHAGGELVGTGLESIFYLYPHNKYRVEFIVRNDGRRWTMLSEDVMYHQGLNSTWRINTSDDIWYEDSVNTTNRTGGTFSNGRVSWNLGLGGRINANDYGVYSYVVNITTTKSESYPVYFLVNDSSIKSGSYDTSIYNISDVDAPYLSLHYPANLDNKTAGLIRFNFTASDNSKHNISCNLDINSNLNHSYSFVNRTINLTVNFASGGLYNWTVNCTDESRNNVISTRYFYVISRPYVSINVTSDNRSMRLNWTGISFADSYNIYISNDSSSFIDVNFTTSDTNWTDNEAWEDNRRYYKVAAVRGNAAALSNVTVGKHTAQQLMNWSLISVPFNITNWRLYNGSVGKNFLSEPHDCIVSLWEYNSANQSYYRTDYIDDRWSPGIGSENFTSLNFSKGYWAEINKTCNLTFYGEVPRQNKTMQLYPYWNIVSHFSAKDQMLGDESILRLVDVKPAETTSVILRYNNILDDFEVTVYYPGYGWWPSFNNQDFTYLESMKGYYFDQLDYANWTHNPRK